MIPHGALTSPDALLLQQAQQGLVVCDAPFAELGRRVGLDGERVVERLRALLGSGVVVRLGPVYADGFDAAGAGGFDQALAEAMAGGLPLLQRPFEALGAMLGVPAAQVIATLLGWQQQGLLLRIAAQLPAQGVG